jgi:two-component system response regulator HydG
MLGYDWPGNVRELENCIQHMVAINSGPLLHVLDLPSNLQNHVAINRSQSMARAAAATGNGSAALDSPERPTSASQAQPAVAAPIVVPASSPVVPLAEIEKRAILGALEYTRGDRAVAAHLLGIGRTTLYRKLKEYRLDEE